MTHEPLGNRKSAIANLQCDGPVVSSPWSRSPLDQPCGEANKFRKCATSPILAEIIAMRRLHRMNREERQRIEQCLAAELATDRSVAFAYLYGSYVESQPFHDIDVGAYLENVRAERLSATALDLAQRLSDTARIPVDVRILNVAPVSFLYHVLRGQLVFCRDDAVLAEVMERTISRYLDIAPLVRRGTQEAFAA